MMVKEWMGLWRAEKDYELYQSQAISKKSLRQLLESPGRNVRLFIRPNKYYKKNSNRPKFQFYLSDSTNDNVNAAEIGNLEKRNVIGADTAAQICRNVLYDSGYGYSVDDLVYECETSIAQNSFVAYVSKESG